MVHNCKFKTSTHASISKVAHIYDFFLNSTYSLSWKKYYRLRIKLEHKINMHVLILVFERKQHYIDEEKKMPPLSGLGQR